MAAVSDFFSLGSIVWCRTCYNKEIEGEVLAFDPPTKVLILKCAPTSGDPKLNDIHFVNLSLVSELQVKKEVTIVPEVPQSLNLQRLNTRIRNQVDEKKRMFQAISANVSSEGQSLFIAIAKTISEKSSKLDVNNKIFIQISKQKQVLDILKSLLEDRLVVNKQEQDIQVIISPPYQLENIRGNTNSKEYTYIRKVVEKHMKDLALNNQSQGVCQNNTLQ